jgi:mRNA deadenylase 3'-5' endonuclease subunit Ccr4
MQRRFPLLVSEILFYAADLVLLQEVDEGVFTG